MAESNPEKSSNDQKIGSQVSAKEADDTFGSLQFPANSAAQPLRSSLQLSRRESYDVQDDPYAARLKEAGRQENIILPGRTYELDPFTGNLIDGTEDLPVSPLVADFLNKERSESIAQASSNSGEVDKVAIDIPEGTDTLLQGNLNNLDTRIALSWTNVTYKVNIGGKKKLFKKKDAKPVEERVILDGITGQARPGETVAIFGSTGAGKTTLLNILAGRVSNGTIGGKIMVNGQKRTRIWKKLVAYVEQDDIMARNLTVRETLRDVALLRLPRTMSHKEKIRRSEEVMEMLGITKCADTIIGDFLNPGISGGERKRTAIAAQIITAPRLLFLDEPTSGLDAYTAYSIIESVTQLARQEAKTVIMTIHQPREDILFLFDKVLLLSQGKTVFFGPVQTALDYFQSLGYFCPRYVNPADFFIDTISLDLTDESTIEESQKRVTRLKDNWANFEAHEQDRRHSSKKMSLLDTADEAYAQAAVLEQDKKFRRQNRKSLWKDDRRNFWWTEFGILLRRCYFDFSREKVVTLGLSVQTIFLFLLISFTFFQLPLTQPGIQARVGVLNFFAANLTFSTVFPLLTLFPLEKRVIRADRYSQTYRISSYYMAKAISVFPFRLILGLFFIASSYYIIGLNPLASRYFIAWLITVVILFTAQAFGLMLGAASPTVELSQIVGPLIVTVFFIYGGNLANAQTIPAVLRWIQWISLVRYCYMSFFQNEFEGLTFACFNGQPPVNNQCIPGFATGEQVIAFYDQDAASITACLFILLGFGIFFHIVAYIAVRISTRPKINLV